MNHKDILTEAMNKAKMTQIQLAKELNVSKATVSTTLRRDNIGLDVFVKYVNELGFEVCVGRKAGDTFIPEWNVSPNNADKRTMRTNKTED